MNPQTICVHMIRIKMGLAGAANEISLAWIEKFFLKASLR
jgi:hypothetical protein